MAADRYEEKPHIWEEKGNWDSLPGQWRFCLPSGGRIPPFAPLGSQSHSKKKPHQKTTKHGDTILLFQITADIRMTNKDADSHGFLDKEMQ